MITLATPLIDPLSAHGLWYVFLVPMAFFVAMAYKAVRIADMTKYWRQVAIFTTQIVLGIGLLGIASIIVVNTVLPLLTPMPTP